MLIFDREKCVECKQCLKACPQLEKNFDFKVLKCNQCGKCIENCPRKAISRVDDAVVINYEKCNKCMKCVEFCSKIINDNGVPKKCNLCFDREQLECVKACAYKAIKLDNEGTLGWKIISSGNYKVKQKNIQRDGIKLINFALDEFRKRYESYDELALQELIGHYCERNKLKLNDSQLSEIIEILKSEICGYSVLDKILCDETLEEISIDENSVFVYDKKLGWLRTNLVLEKQKIIELINKMGRGIKRRITTKSPMLNSEIQNARVHAIINPISKNDNITIRLFSKKKLGEGDFQEIITKQAINFLKLAVKCNINLIIAGNTGSGKTSLLNLVLSFIDRNERIILVEETPELKVECENNVCLVVNKPLGVRMPELVTETLRMRPDRVAVGEIREADEVKAFVNTMLAGQGKGSFATFHAENSEECLIRMQSLGIKEMDLHAIDLIVVIKRWTDNREKKEIRKVTEIATIKPNYGKLELEKIFAWENGKLALKNLDNKVSEKIRQSYHISQKKLGELVNA